MKFVVSSTELLSHLQTTSKVISSKNTIPILDNFLFKLEDNELEITASDLESTVITKIRIENSEGNGSIAVPSKLLNDTLKEFPEQPLTFDVNTDSFSVDIYSENGKFCIMGLDPVDFPQIPDIEEENVSSVEMAPGVLHHGIAKTLFATADDEMRIIMNGIFIEFFPDHAIFVASDAHKLVRYTRSDVTSSIKAGFILPKKPAALLKNILPKETNPVKLRFDDKNAYFTLTNYTLVSRLTEGKYPNYDAVIPKDNPFSMVIDRIALHNTLRRVSVFSNQASNLVKLKLENNQVVVSAQDIDFSISAYERLVCQYEGEEMEIGFKSTFLIEMLNNMSSADVVFKLSDPSRAGVIVPFEKEIDEEDELMLIMPMMVSA